MGDLLIRRAYSVPDTGDGYRILVDRLWPRGVSKERLAVEEWAKEVAPTSQLRTAFGHREENFNVFRAGYVEELEKNPAALEWRQRIMDRLKMQNVTLVYGAKSETINHAVVLRDWLLAGMEQ